MIGDYQLLAVHGRHRTCRVGRRRVRMHRTIHQTPDLAEQAPSVCGEARDEDEREGTNECEEDHGGGIGRAGYGDVIRRLRG
jgi:hypothetical protein